jgi:sugar phosphate isomerase/epimerase
MSRPITLFTGQWADLKFEDLCKKVSSWGYDGVEIACWGDHLVIDEAAKNPKYCDEKKAILKKYNLNAWAIGTHIIGQCVGDPPDKRLNQFAPKEHSNNPEAIRKWAIEQMKLSAKAAKSMGCYVVTGFMGSPIWKWVYSFPPTTPEMVEDGYKEIVDLWTPILDEFDRQGVKFALEVHPAEIAFDLYSTKKLFEVFENRPALGLNFDPSHLVWQGVDPALFYREFADKIYHVHIKDAKVNLDGKTGILGSHLQFGDLKRGWNFVSPGHGDVNFDRIIREANAAKYGGPLSVEWEDNGMDREFGAQEALELVKRINFSPSDVAFDSSMES